MSVLSVHHHRVREGHSQEQLVDKRSPSHSKYGVVLRSPPDPCTCSTLQDHHQHRFYKPLAKAGQVSTTLLLCPPSSPSTGTTHHPGRKIVLCCCTCPLPGRSPPGPLFPGPPAPPPPPRPLEHSIPMHTCRRNSANPCLVLASTMITITGKEVTGHLPIPIGQVNRRVAYQSGGCCSKVPRSDQMRSDQSR